jgi:chromosome segregation ATPase
MLANDEYLSGQIKGLRPLVDSCLTKLNGFYSQLTNHENRIGKNESDIEHYVSGMTHTVSNFASELSNLKNKVSNLDYSSNTLLSSSNDFEERLNEIKESDIRQNSQIKINVNDIQDLKDKLIKYSETLANVNSVQNLNINEILLTNSSILYYVGKVEERISLLDDRMDHLERLIRGLREPEDWDDWNLLFRLLNLLQLKISKLSITNKVAVNETPMTNTELAEFQFILREIEHKLKRLPYDQVKDTGVDILSIQEVLASLETMETIDPNKFEYYPLYPAITEDPENN